MGTKKLVKAEPKDKVAVPSKKQGKDIRDMTPEELRKFREWLADQEKEQTVPQPIFYLRGVPYLPMYLGEGKHRWVGPGNEHTRKIYTTTELTEAGAKLEVTMLWKRSWTEEVKGWIH
jgi:hypothetical protein